jgi:mannose-6-phosphate isomerase-like protein (cupin superfamily)
LCLGFLAAWAADTAPVTYWSAADLKGFEKKLGPKINAGKVPTGILTDHGSSLTMVAHREGDGEAELHETFDDYFVVQSGEGTLLYGGEMVGGRTTQPHEIRGPSIKGASRQKLGAGDVVHIAAGVPHQTLVAAGKQSTYFLIKVRK